MVAVVEGMSGEDEEEVSARICEAFEDASDDGSSEDGDVERVVGIVDGGAV